MMNKAYLKSKLEYGKPIWMVFRMEGDGLLGDGKGVIEPGEIWDGKTYEEIYQAMKADGFIEIAETMLEKAA